MAAAAEGKRFENVIPLLAAACVGPVEARCDDELTHLMERIWRDGCINGRDDNWGRYWDGHFELGQRLGGGVGQCGCGYHTQFTDYLLTPIDHEVDKTALAKLSKAKLIEAIMGRLVVFGYTYESLNALKKVDLINLIHPKYSINIMGMHKLIYHRSQIPAAELAKLNVVIDIYNQEWMRTTYEQEEIKDLKFN
jgi:hypothetical protein